MKRIIATTLIPLLFLAAALSSCTQQAKINEKKISIVCTIFPQYDWARQILGDKIEYADLTLLLKNRIDLHSYQPSVDDIVAISSCDLFIYVGGESDGWVIDVLKQSVNRDMLVINLLDILGESVKVEEIIEGMEKEDDKKDKEGDVEADDIKDKEGDVEEDDKKDKEADLEAEDKKDKEADLERDVEEDDIGCDEHVWLSLKNAKLLCPAIAGAISSLDSVNADEYRNNLDAYLEKLTALDSEYQKALDSTRLKTLLFGDRFPFRYLVDDYGLDYYAAFVGCSAETEASFETIIFLANKTDALGLANIMVTESSDKKIAETIIRESKDSDRQILVLNSIQSVVPSDIENGATYLSIMESNLSVLIEALE